MNPQGQTVYQALTAQQIFDPRDVNGNATASNAFAALTSLVTDLNAGNTSEYYERSHVARERLDMAQPAAGLLRNRRSRG